MLIVEDDKRLVLCLARAMEARGFKVMTAELVFDGLAQIKLSAPEYAVVDMRFDDECGLDVISALKEQRPDARPSVDVDDIVSALLAPERAKAEPPQHPMSAARVRWEHIQHVHEAYGHKVSETARRLNLHRRTLQRILTLGGGERVSGRTA